jgi:hypothetical protein
MEGQPPRSGGLQGFPRDWNPRERIPIWRAAGEDWCRHAHTRRGVRGMEGQPPRSGGLQGFPRDWNPRERIPIWRATE